MRRRVFSTDADLTFTVFIWREGTLRLPHPKMANKIAFFSP